MEHVVVIIQVIVDEDIKPQLLLNRNFYRRAGKLESMLLKIGYDTELEMEMNRYRGRKGGKRRDR